MFACSDQGEGSLKLLDREQPKCVTHDYGCAGAARKLLVVAWSAERDDERRKTKVCLGLTSAGWEPEKVCALAIVVQGISQPGQHLQDEPDLQWSPVGA